MSPSIKPLQRHALQAYACHLCWSLPSHWSLRTDDWICPSKAGSRLINSPISIKLFCNNQIHILRGEKGPLYTIWGMYDGSYFISQLLYIFRRPDDLISFFFFAPTSLTSCCSTVFLSCRSLLSFKQPLLFMLKIHKRWTATTLLCCSNSLLTNLVRITYMTDRFIMSRLTLYYYSWFTQCWMGYLEDRPICPRESVSASNSLLCGKYFTWCDLLYTHYS